MAIAARPLAAVGLELRAVQRLIADVRLRAVVIGRRGFTRVTNTETLPPENRTRTLTPSDVTYRRCATVESHVYVSSQTRDRDAS